MATTDNKIINGSGLSELSSQIKSYVNDKTEISVGAVAPTDNKIKLWVDTSATGSTSANEVSFNNANTGLTATNVQSALEEINSDLVGSEQVQEMIDNSTLEPLESPTVVDIVFKASEIYDGSQDWLLSAVNNNNLGQIDFLLECDIEIPAELSKNAVQIIYRTNGTVSYGGKPVHFKKGHTYSFMLMTSNATYWTSMAESFVRNSYRVEIPYGQPILVCPHSNAYPRKLYQMVDITPVVANGNEVAY